MIGAAEGMKEDRESWKIFLTGLKERGLTGTQLFIGEKCLGLLDTINEVYPDAKYQRCTVHFKTSAKLNRHDQVTAIYAKKQRLWIHEKPPRIISFVGQKDQKN